MRYGGQPRGTVPDPELLAQVRNLAEVAAGLAPAAAAAAFEVLVNVHGRADVEAAVRQVAGLERADLALSAGEVVEGCVVASTDISRASAAPGQQRAGR
ncbi:hypothetical protein [Saccharopolyspora elongata]|uniref:Uncharacterized protein n=1 Tax=Saccharopolyspora elongata TaxID=2530387 RepID=A0A4R4YS98_9PSEU|nr:hypothetical protein [Saccharopolyspora elongata]TDD48158.1 hypothetical protein E1288_22980 [Saccharopolyspora elongata]